MLRPSMALGIPALGITTSGSEVTAAIRSIAVNTPAGPELQLTPIASAPHAVSFAAALSLEAPSRQFASSSTVTSAMTGTPGAASAAARMPRPEDRNARPRLGFPPHRLFRFVERRDRLDHQHVDSTRHQPANLFRESG